MATWKEGPPQAKGGLGRLIGTRSSFEQNTTRRKPTAETRLPLLETPALGEPYHHGKPNPVID